MHYYQHHIGDFDRATRHLTRIERSVYLDLLFLYYESEQALLLDIAALCRRIVARSEDEKAAVLAVLDEFFHDTPGGWFHDRCEEEIAEYRKSKSQASAAGKASAAARADRRMVALGIIQTVVERISNENPTTVERPLNDRATEVQRDANDAPTNHEPVTSNHKKSSRSSSGAYIAEDWHPSPDDTTFCKTERPDLKASDVAKRFYDHWIAQPGTKGRKSDWSATWRNWVRNERPGKEVIVAPPKKDWI